MPGAQQRPCHVARRPAGPAGAQKGEREREGEGEGEGEEGGGGKEEEEEETQYEEAEEQEGECMEVSGPTTRRACADTRSNDGIGATGGSNAARTGRRILEDATILDRACVV